MFDIHKSVYDPDAGEVDGEAFEEYTEALLEEFAASPEAQPVLEQYDNLWWARILMEYAMNYLGVTPPEMSVSNFEEVVFEIFPRKVSTKPESAPEAVAELRAFWTYLQRAYNLPNAGLILGRLGDDAVKRLERELANPANYGMAKSFFMQGQELGFDMSTEEGANAFMLYYNSQLAAGMPPGPLGGAEFDDSPDEEDDLPAPRESLTPKQRAELRKKRKAHRQDRKRSRRKK